METEITVLVCMRVADLDEPKAQSVVEECEICHAAVWKAQSSPEANRIYCAACAEREVRDRRDQNLPVEFGQPSANQLKEFKDFYGLTEKQMAEVRERYRWK